MLAARHHKELPTDGLSLLILEVYEGDGNTRAIGNVLKAVGHPEGATEAVEDDVLSHWLFSFLRLRNNLLCAALRWLCFSFKSI